PPYAGQDAAAAGNQYRAEIFARCARGEHQVGRKYGTFGVIMALACFPIGLICLFTDSQKVCSQCGVTID
ncbi:hypothetical protein CPC08DRAFT_594992, partial [Agrocybe pediades]